MANSYRHSGKHIPIASASAAITSGAIVVQEGFRGVAIKSIASGASGWIDVEGVHLLPCPATTAKGDLLYVPGAPATETASATLTKTATSNTLFGRAVGDLDANNKALVLILPQI